MKVAWNNRNLPLSEDEKLALKGFSVGTMKKSSDIGLRA
jgi:hypothetical protein